jgi:hypothetical protein
MNCHQALCFTHGNISNFRTNPDHLEVAIKLLRATVCYNGEAVNRKEIKANVVLLGKCLFTASTSGRTLDL